MAQAIKTVLTYNLDGTTKDFNIPFEYLARKFVVVTLIGVDRKVLTLNQDYRFATRTTLSTTVAWGQAQGYTQIEIRRYTSATERLVDFTDGSILRAYDLNVSQVQTLHVAEEARDLTADTIGVNNDGHLDARGRRIVNLANAVDDRDAIPLGQLKTMNQNAWDARNQSETFKNQAQGFRNEAEASRSAAEAAKDRAGASELKAKDWAVKMDGVVEANSYSAKYYSTLTASDRTASAQSRDAAQQAQRSAEQAQTSASNSQISASTSANTAKQEADRAKGYADAFGNTLDIGKVVASMNTTTNAVEWKGTHYTTNFVGSKSATSNLGLETEGGRAQVVVSGAGGGWRYFQFPSVGGAIATREWTNQYLQTGTTTISLQGSGFPRAWAVNSDGNIGVWNVAGNKWDLVMSPNGTMHQSGTFKVGSSDYAGLELTRADGGYTRIEQNPLASAAMLTFVTRNAAGANQHVITVPRTNGLLATQDWVKANVSAQLSRYRVVGTYTCVESNSWGGNFGGRFDVDLTGKVFIYTSGGGGYWCTGLQCGGVQLLHIGSGSGTNCYLRVEGQWLKSNESRWRPAKGADKVEIIEFY